MSSQASFVSVATATQGNAAPVPGFLMQHTGSVYQATPVAVADGETQGFAIDAFGHLKVIGSAAINTPQLGNPVSIGGRYDLTLPTLDDGDQAAIQHDNRGRVIVTDDQLLAAFSAADFATETTLAAILADTASLDGKDFATETTLAAILADTASLDGKDFATETTLAAILADTASLDGKDFATQTTLADLLTAFTGEDFATETTLAAILADTAIISGWSLGAGAVDANTQRVHLSDESVAALSGTGDVVDTAYINASSTNIPGNATNPVELIASLSADISKVQVFDTTGFFLEIMVGAAAAETRKFLIGPGSNETIDVTIASGTRISVRRIDDPAAIAIGELAVNFIS